MSSVPPARSIRVGARASIRNFAHLVLVVIRAAAIPIGGAVLARAKAEGRERSGFPASRKVSQNVKHDLDQASLSVANRGS